MMHVGEGVLFRRKYREETKVYGGLYCNKIAMREKWNRDLSSLSSRNALDVYLTRLSSQRSNSSILGRS